MATVNIHAAKTNLSKLVDQAAAGEEIVIARAGKPVARLVSLEAAPKRRRLGILKGKMRLPDDFDDPLPDWLLDAFEGKNADPA
jgi:prevent-host-death family protein